VTGKKRTKDEYTDQAAYMSLNKNLIEPLQKHWRFITETKIGTHHIISLTEEGNTPYIFSVRIFEVRIYCSRVGLGILRSSEPRKEVK